MWFRGIFWGLLIGLLAGGLPGRAVVQAQGDRSGLGGPKSSIGGKGAGAKSAEDKSKGDKSKSEKSRAEKPLAGSSGAKSNPALVGEVIITPAREAAAMTFASRHHPELADLISQLKVTSHPEYQRAVQELFRTSERLARSQERSPERYELELKDWVINSRIRLLAARLAMSQDQAAEETLKLALRERLEIRLRLLQHERDKLASRLKRLEQDVVELESDQESAVDAEFERLKRELNGTRATLNPQRTTNSPSSLQPATKPVSAEKVNGASKTSAGGKGTGAASGNPR